MGCDAKTIDLGEKKVLHEMKGLMMHKAKAKQDHSSTVKFSEIWLLILLDSSARNASVKIEDVRYTEAPGPVV